MQLKLDADGYIVGYATVGGFPGGVEATEAALLPAMQVAGVSTLDAEGADEEQLSRLLSFRRLLRCYRWLDGALYFDDGKRAEAEIQECEMAMAAIRLQRDDLLRKSDEYMWADRPMADELRSAWRTYRQALRDLPETIADPLAAIVWPTSPAEQEAL